MFAQAVELEGTTASDWVRCLSFVCVVSRLIDVPQRQAMNAALASLLQEEELLAKCDLLYHPIVPEAGSHNVVP